MTNFTLTAGTAVSAGQTIRVDDEQMFITSVSTNEIYVERGINGTTAATHSDEDVVYIYDYPWDIVHACLIQVMRWWKRKDTAYAEIIGTPALGAVVAKKGLDPDIRAIVQQYKKSRYQ